MKQEQYCKRFWICKQKFSRFADQITICEHMNPQGSSWDPANALKIYKDISSQPYLQDDKFTTKRPCEILWKYHLANNFNVLSNS